VRSFVTGRMDKLGDAYATGDLLVDGTVQDILQIGMQLAERFGRISRLAAMARPLQRLRFRHSRKNDAAAIPRHYDVSNDFYRLWLDDSMTYSCAYFLTGTEDIDRGQEQKIDHICRKLDLRAGETILDIGCGWGGLSRRAASRYGVKAVGVTNSPAQYRYACERVVAGRLGDAVEIRLQDYRDIFGAAAFDRIVSVGMYEHVGLGVADLSCRDGPRLRPRLALGGAGPRLQAARRSPVAQAVAAVINMRRTGRLRCRGHSTGTPDSRSKERSWDGAGFPLF